MGSHPYKREHQLRDAASMGQVIEVQCHLCHRTIFYLASDLETILPPTTIVWRLPFNCAQCGKRDYLKIRVRLPDQRDFGSMIIRRPAGEKRVLLWRDEKLR
jgi:predicted nucleic-acid-binding Zn-ribbon protein